MREHPNLMLWHSIMNTYQIGGHDRQPVQYVLVHNRYLGLPNDIFIVDKARLPGVMDISLSQEVDSPAHSFAIVCEDKDGLLSPDYYQGKTPISQAFRGHLDSAWKGQLQTNAKIEIHFGYGEQVVRVLTGLIDSVVINAEAQTITMTGRSMYKRMLDNTCIPEPGKKFALPWKSTPIELALKRLFSKGNVKFEGAPVVDEESGEDMLIGEEMGLRGEPLDSVARPLVNSTFFYLYELPTGVVQQRELPRYSEQAEAVFTVDDQMHLTALEYKYDDTNIFGTVIVETGEVATTYSSKFLATKFLNGERRETVISYPWANTPYKRRLAALAYITNMLYRVRTVTVNIPANPLLELYDPIRLQEKISTVSRSYHIRSIDYSFNGGGFTQTLQCSINTGFAKPTPPKLPPTYLPTLLTNKENITLSIWDSGGNDLDVITIKLNGEVVQGNLILKESMESVSLTLKKGTNTIEFIGVSAGKSGGIDARFYAMDDSDNMITSGDLMISMPRTEVNDLGFYTGKKPVKKWVVGRA